MTHVVVRRLARFVIAVAVAAATLGAASPAAAQTPPAQESKPVFTPIGEKYWIEFTATFWMPTAGGSVASSALDLIGSTIDFTTDLGFSDTRERDLRLVLRPWKKHKFRFQHTPAAFSASAILARDITFAGTVYPVELPVESALSWNVMRFGYEWDFFYRPRGYVGVLVELRHMDLAASIDSLLGSGQLEATGPMPAIGVVSRVNVTKNLAVNVELSTLKLTDLTPDHELWLVDIEVSATYNLARYVGIAGGWRRQNTSLVFGSDSGELDFKGFWIGGTVRY